MSRAWSDHQHLNLFALSTAAAPFKSFCGFRKPKEWIPRLPRYLHLRSRSYLSRILFQLGFNHQYFQRHIAMKANHDNFLVVCERKLSNPSAIAYPALIIV